MKKHLPLKLSVVLLFLTSMIQAQLDPIENDKKYQGLLWEITGNGLEEPSYLYGTMHVSQKLAFHLSDSFYLALESCDMVALELNPETWMDEITKEKPTNSYSGGYYGYESSYFYNSAFKFEPVQNRLLGAQLAYDGQLINSLLYRSTGYSDDFEEDTYLDLYIFQTGKRMGLDIIALEDFDEVEIFAVRSTMPDKDDGEDAHYFDDRIYEGGLGPGQLLEDAYRKGDLDMIDSLNYIFNSSKNFRKYMLDVRNEGMVYNMDSLMQSGINLFTGVGASHLPGDMGVINLLKEEGYDLRPIERELGGKSKKYGKKYDEMTVPVEYSLKMTEDEFIQCELPGTLYNLAGSGNIKVSAYPDMANGVYYFIRRINTLNILNKPDGISNSEHILSRMDSLLFENIPGEIISQKDITICGYPGIDVLNETSKGDFDRYQIIATPIELIIFKMGGVNDYVKDNGSKFFNSIHISTPNKGEWKTIFPEHGGFKIDMPAYNVSYDKLSYYGVSKGLEYYAVENEDELYIVHKSTVTDNDYLEEDSFELNHIADLIKENLEFDSVHVNEVEFKGYSAADIHLFSRANTLEFKGKIIIQGPNYFLLGLLSPDGKSADRMINSWEVTDFEYEDEFELYTDTIFSFEVMDIKKTKMQIEMGKIQEEMYEIYEDDDEEDLGLEGDYNTFMINSGDTKENVELSVVRMNVFYEVENIDTIWDRSLERYKEEYSVLDESRVITDSTFVLSFILSDSTSSPRISKKIILRDQYRYEISMYLDPKLEESEFVTTVLNSFHPIDNGKDRFSVFESKSPLFFDLVNSGDSARIAFAFENIYMVEFTDDDREKLIDLIENGSFEHDFLPKKVALISALSGYYNKENINYLKELYELNEDTVSYQMAALQTMSFIRNEYSFETIYELLTEQTPIPKNATDLSGIYYAFQDSLELCEDFFPGLLALNSIPEYKSYNINLLSNLIESGTLEPRKLRKHKNALINEAYVEYKRHRADQEDVEDESYNYYNNYYSSNNNSLDVVVWSQVVFPYYMKDDRVKKVIDNMMKTTNKDKLVDMGLLLERNGFETEDTLWSSLASDYAIKEELMYKLRRYEMMNLVDSTTWFSDQEMSLAQLVTEAKYDGDTDTTNFNFLEKIEIDSKNGVSDYYFYTGWTLNYSDKKEWHLYYIGPYNDDEYTYTSLSKVTIKNDEDMEIIDEKKEDIIDKLKLNGRRRAGGNNYDYY